MKSKVEPTIDQLESKLSGWEKWLYAGTGAAIILLVQAFIKAYENQMLVNVFFSIDMKAGAENLNIFQQYSTGIFQGLISPWRILLWLSLEFAVLIPAAILAFHPTWRKIPLGRRLDLIFGYLLAGWVTLLSPGAQDPNNAGGGYIVLVIVYLLALGLGYWWLRRKKDTSEEVFP